MRRVLIIGSGGAGKSVLAVRAGQALGLPVIHLDQENWRPGWVETPRDEWHARVDVLLARECWIMDGNYGGTLERRVAACDSIVFLDRPRWLCMWRILKRRMPWGVRVGMAEGCPDKLDVSFATWVWGFRGRQRPRIRALLEASRPTKRVITLKSERDVEEFLKGCQRD